MILLRRPQSILTERVYLFNLSLGRIALTPPLLSLDASAEQMKLLMGLALMVVFIELLSSARFSPSCRSPR